MVVGWLLNMQLASKTLLNRILYIPVSLVDLEIGATLNATETNSWFTTRGLKECLWTSTCGHSKYIGVTFFRFTE